MATYFTQIFWGLLLALADITINKFDILPDFIGYILVGVGCAGLAAASRRFSVARTCSIFLTLIALTDYFGADRYGVLVGYIRMVLDCMMMWMLLGGIIELARSRERADLAQITANRRAVYVSFIVFIFLIAWMGPPTRGLSMPIFVFCFALMVFVVCLNPECHSPGEARVGLMEVACSPSRKAAEQRTL